MLRQDMDEVAGLEVAIDRQIRDRAMQCEFIFAGLDGSNSNIGCVFRKFISLLRKIE